MAGSLALTVASDHPMLSTRDQWPQIHFSRFFPFPNPPLSSTCPSLVTLQLRSRRKRGTWLSTSSPDAYIHIIKDSLTSDAILAVYFRGNILEEHYISKLQFSWPQVSCVSGYPTRGSRTLFALYQDSVGEIQKFALHFPTIYEAESFINSLKETLNNEEEPEHLISDFPSEISSASEFMSSSGLPSRACEEEVCIMTPGYGYAPEIPPTLNYEGEKPSCSQATKPSHNFEGIYPALPHNFEQPICTQETKLTHNFEGICQALPPSFTSLMSNCCSEVKQEAAQPIVSEDVDLKSLVARYMEDSSFQDLLSKVEKIISEAGGDLSLTL